MKKLILSAVAFILALCGSLAFSPSAFALDPCQCSDPLETNLIGNCTKDGKTMLCDGSGSGKSIFKIISIVLTVMLAGVGILGTIGIIVSGVMMLTARDNEGQVQRAKKRILDIVIGMVAFGLFWLIVELLLPGGSANIMIIDFSDMNKQGSGQPIITQPTGLPPASSHPSSSHPASSHPSSSHPASSQPASSQPASSQPASSQPVVGDDALCGPRKNPPDKVDGGSATKLYTNNYGRRFYVFKQASSPWGSMPAGTSSDGSPGTMKGRGCYRTSIATMFRSFGYEGFTPAKLSTSGKTGMSIDTAVRKYPQAKNYLTYTVKSGTPATNSSTKTDFKNRIKNAITGGGAVILRIKKNGSNDFTSSQHSMPAIDYRVRNGKEEIYIGNTTNKNTGWFDLDYIVGSKKVNIVQIVVVMPKKSGLTCK